MHTSLFPVCVHCVEEIGTSFAECVCNNPSHKHASGNVPLLYEKTVSKEQNNLAQGVGRWKMEHGGYWSRSLHTSSSVWEPPVTRGTRRCCWPAAGSEPPLTTTAWNPCAALLPSLPSSQRTTNNALLPMLKAASFFSFSGAMSEVSDALPVDQAQVDQLVALCSQDSLSSNDLGAIRQLLTADTRLVNAKVSCNLP